MFNVLIGLVVGISGGCITEEAAMNWDLAAEANDSILAQELLAGGQCGPFPQQLPAEIVGFPNTEGRISVVEVVLPDGRTFWTHAPTDDLKRMAAEKGREAGLE